MKIQAYALARVVSWILGKTVFLKIKKIVSLLNSSTLTGAERKKEARRSLAKGGLNIDSYLINLGIEVAVALLRSE